MAAIKIKLTDAIIKAVDNSITRITDTDIPGFHVRYGKPKQDSTRTAKFYLYYRIGGRGGKEVNYLIGSSAKFTCSEARKEAKSLAGRVASGEDIKATSQDKIKANIAKHKELTVNDLINDFINLSIMQTRKQPQIAIDSLDNDVRPTIGKLKLSELELTKIMKSCLDPIKARGSRVQANKTLSLLKQMFQFGVERGQLKYNVLAGTTRKNVGGKEKKRDRSLTLDEIKYFFNWLNHSTASSNVKHCLHLQLLTGCRTGELVQSKWENVDFDKRVWHFPAEIRKGGKDETKAHNVYLTDLMIKHLESLQNSHALLDPEYVFPSIGKNGAISHIDNRAVARFVKRRFDDDDLEMESFVPHDIRRTFTTNLRAMKIDAVVVEKLLSHELQGMLKVYDQHDYAEERKAALIKWSKKINKLVGKG